MTEIPPAAAMSIEPLSIETPHAEPPYQELPYVEPWMRGTHGDVPVVGRAVLHALELALEDILKWSTGLTETDLQVRPFGLNSAGFHMRHIARSIDRILSYAEGRTLSPEQMKSLRTEQDLGGSPAGLLAEVDAAFDAAAKRVRALAETDLEAVRGIGRKQLPSSVGSALIHVADHTQRHVGQLITTVQLLRAMSRST